jgi:integrase
MRGGGPPTSTASTTVVLTRDEVRAVIRELQRPTRFMAILLYGAGLRLLECARHRVKDVNFATNQINVRAGKGDRDALYARPEPGPQRRAQPRRPSGALTRGGWLEAAYHDTRPGISSVCVSRRRAAGNRD